MACAARALAGDPRSVEIDSINRRMILILYFLHCGQLTTSPHAALCYRHAPQTVETLKQTGDPT
jgi:hypothetical protein